MICPENIELFRRHRVLSPEECTARYEIMVEHYARVMSIEAKTLLEMVRRQVQPALIGYCGKVAAACNAMAQAAGAPSVAAHENLSTLMELTDCVAEGVKLLAQAVEEADHIAVAAERAAAYCGPVRRAMETLRRCCDAAETLVDSRDWPMPTYTDLLHRV